MNTLLWWLGQNTLAVAVMIPFVLLGCRWFRHRPAVCHVLWLVVLVKFLTPAVVSWPWTVQQLRESCWPAQAVTSPDAETAGIVLPPLPPEPESPAAGNPVAAVGSLPAGLESTDKPVDLPEITAVSEAAAPDESSWAVIGGVVLTVWGGGAVCCLLWQFRRMARHASFIRRGTAAPARLTTEIGTMAKRLGVRPPRTVLARGIRSPFMWCLGRLRLIWPAMMAGETDVLRSRGVIAHELAHVRRGDHWVAWLELLAGVLWWWNPLFWFVRRRLRESAEMACDALAINAQPEGRREYAELFLELSAGFNTGVPSTALAVGAGAPSSFERRLSMILSDRVSGKLSPRGLLAAIGFALVFLPGWSLGQPAEPSKNTPAPADDPVLRGLIETGKFAEAKDRLEALRKKREADKSVTEGVFPEKWKAILTKELPPVCLKGLPKDAVLSWKSCMQCHASGPKVDAAPVKPTTEPAGWHNSLRWPNRDPFAAMPMLSFNGNGRIYQLTFAGNGAILEALNADRKTLWKSGVIDSLPARSPGDVWTLGEPKDVKEVVLSFAGKNGRSDYHFETNTGKLVRKNVTPSSGADLPPLALAASNAGQLILHKGETRIYILVIGDRGASLAAIDPIPGKLLWRTSFGEKLPVYAERSEWKILETQANGEAVAVTCRRSDFWANFYFQGSSGNLTRKETSQAPAVDADQALRATPAMQALALELAQAEAQLANLRKQADQLRKVLPADKPELNAAVAKAEQAELHRQLIAARIKELQQQADADRAIREQESKQRQLQDELKLAQDAEKVQRDLAAAIDRQIKDAWEAKILPADKPAPPRPVATAPSPLDLGERYLKALADLKTAKSRITRQSGNAVPQQEIDESMIELERAQKLAELLHAHIKDAIVSAKAASEESRADLARIEQLMKKGMISGTEADRAKSRVSESETRVKQLEAILGLGSSSSPNVPPKIAPAGIKP